MKHHTIAGKASYHFLGPCHLLDCRLDACNQFRDAKRNQLSLEELDRINTPVQHSSTGPVPKIPLKEVERYQKNEIPLPYEVDMAEQLAADNLRDIESAKYLLNDRITLHRVHQNGPHKTFSASNIFDRLELFRPSTR